MSFVSLFLTRDFIVVTSDGQLTNMETMKAENNNFKKFEQLTPYQYLAFTGDLALAKIVFNRCKKKIRNNSTYCNLKELSIFIKRILDNYKEEAQCCFALCGFDKKNNPEYYIIHSSASHIDSQILYNDKFIGRVLTSDYLNIETHEISMDLYTYFEKEDFKNQEIVITKLNDTNSLVSQHDTTVNDTFYYHVFNRKYSLKEVILDLIDKLRKDIAKSRSF
ncbi:MULTISPECIES: hypothetical protein [unclassified Lysinibacillus]|uniref:hypothetical protein n=1 Tax=unclassified Lysinibacillus TaxID=2636778 RepID=UPI003816B63F